MAARRRATRRRATGVLATVLAMLALPVGGGADAAFRPTVVADLPGPYQGTTEAVVALTFDDGPHPVWTPAVLDVLNRYDVPATFFQMGALAARHPDIVRRVVDDGHVLGNHTWSHPDLTRLPAGAWDGEVDRTTRQLTSLGHQPLRCLRPPFGATSAAVRQQIAARGLAEALWTIDPQDFRRRDAGVIADRVLAELRPGAVILLHDGPGDRSQTVAALPRIIEGIHAAGYRIVPVCGSTTRGPERPAVGAFGPVRVGDLTGGTISARRLVGMAPTPGSAGYWLAAADGGVFTYGDATFRGSAGNLRLAAPVVSIAATPTGRGYWLAAADGGVFTFGDAAYHGGLGHVRLDSPVVAITATPTGRGYWLAAADGGVFTYGDATYHGAASNLRLAAPVVGIAATPTGRGYLLAAADGGVFTYGDATYHGSRAGVAGVSHRAIVAAPGPNGGYWLLGARPA